MNPADFILAILATFGLSDLLANEKGPGNLFVEIRTWPSNANVRQGLACSICQGVWWSALIVLFLAVIGRLVPLAWMAANGGSVALTKGVR